MIIVTGTYNGQPARLVVRPGKATGYPDSFLAQVRAAIVNGAWVIDYPMPQPGHPLNRDNAADIAKYAQQLDGFIPDRELGQQQHRSSWSHDRDSGNNVVH